MHLRGEYVAAQDRVLLKLRGGPSREVALWLTRRQWLAIALACQEARSIAELQGERQGRQRKGEAGDGSEAGGGDGDTAASLVSAVRFQRVPFGLRIKLTTEERASFFLPIIGENLRSFGRQVERLAARAKWDLPAAIERVRNAKRGQGQKQLVN